MKIAVAVERRYLWRHEFTSPTESSRRAITIVYALCRGYKVYELDMTFRCK